VTLSTAEAEYIALSMEVYEAMWLLTDLFDHEMDPIITCDNQSYVKLSENPVFHDRSKHIEIKHHFQRHDAEESSTHAIPSYT
jgi:hypothetical protein